MIGRRTAPLPGDPPDTAYRHDGPVDDVFTALVAIAGLGADPKAAVEAWAAKAANYIT